MAIASPSALPSSSNAPCTPMVTDDAPNTRAARMPVAAACRIRSGPTRLRLAETDEDHSRGRDVPARIHGDRLVRLGVEVVGLCQSGEARWELDTLDTQQERHGGLLLEKHGMAGNEFHDSSDDAPHGVGPAITHVSTTIGVTRSDRDWQRARVVSAPCRTWPLSSRSSAWRSGSSRGTDSPSRSWRSGWRCHWRRPVSSTSIRHSPDSATAPSSSSPRCSSSAPRSTAPASRRGQGNAYRAGRRRLAPPARVHDAAVRRADRGHQRQRRRRRTAADGGRAGRSARPADLAADDAAGIRGARRLDARPDGDAGERPRPPKRRTRPAPGRSATSSSRSSASRC